METLGIAKLAQHPSAPTLESIGKCRLVQPDQNPLLRGKAKRYPHFARESNT